ncbi:hypothetical protein L195_g036468, partial [Trifolium pratense]
MSLDSPSFYHAYQMDVEDQITNVFWADARMLFDYGYFGDVVSLDSTYCTNSSYRPLAVFSGFNHHRKAVIFGAALLYDETAESYKWLFETFLEAHKQKTPQTVFTDQDQAMAKALVQVMPGAYHGLCTWHLMQNCIKHLSHLMKGESHFLSDFKKCMYGYDDEKQFEESWRTLLVNYNGDEEPWLRRAYSLKEKWASCYMNKAFTLGMRSTQLSESVNADIKSFMNVDLDIIKFLKRFEDVVEEMRYNELRVFIHLDVKSVPEPYIMKRWTKSARSGELPIVGISHVVEDIDLSPKQRYQKICPRLIRIASEACRSPETFTFITKVVDELERQILRFQNSQ